MLRVVQRPGGTQDPSVQFLAAVSSMEHQVLAIPTSGFSEPEISSPGIQQGTRTGEVVRVTALGCSVGTRVLCWTLTELPGAGWSSRDPPPRSQLEPGRSGRSVRPSQRRSGEGDGSKRVSPQQLECRMPGTDALLYG